MTDGRADRFLEVMRLREAVASVSLSHPASCDCKICRAGAGDEQAMAEVIVELEEISERDREG